MGRTLSVATVGLSVLTAPILVHELIGFLEDFPLFIGKLDALAVDPSRPWLQKVVGEGLGAAQQSVWRIDDTRSGMDRRLRASDLVWGTGIDIGPLSPLRYSDRGVLSLV